MYHDEQDDLASHDFPDYTVKRKRGRPRKTFQPIQKRGNLRLQNKQIIAVPDMKYHERLSYENTRRWCHKNPELAELIADIVEHKHKCSMSLLEHLITVYAKEHKVKMEDGVLLSSRYKSHLPKSYSDPCRRGRRMIMPLKSGRAFETTIAQMNCMKWIVTTCVLRYAEDNFDSIKLSLDAYRKKKKKLP